MTTSIVNIHQLEISSNQSEALPSITEPFTAGRAAPRLLFDFSVMISLMKLSVLDQPVLDFGAGTGWVSEFCSRMGMQTVAFDIHGDLKTCLEGRVKADSRINPSLLGFTHGDGHAMPFEEDTFGHLLCYDTLHHMHDYPKVFAEFLRVLKKGGDASSWNQERVTVPRLKRSRLLKRRKNTIQVG
jgi:ubiquinone/menaquinone biosynthesis C-methylase UbiE